MSAIENFLRESNAIEDVFDEASLADQYRAWGYLCGEWVLSLEVVLGTHQRLMYRHLGNEAGRIRLVDVMVGRKVPPAPWKVPALLAAWTETWSAAPPTTADACLSAHIAFEKIHPFVDGNGRVGRLLWQWQRLQAGLEPLVIWAGKRQAYYQLFETGH